MVIISNCSDGTAILIFTCTTTVNWRSKYQYTPHKYVISANGQWTVISIIVTIIRVNSTQLLALVVTVSPISFHRWILKRAVWGQFQEFLWSKPRTVAMSRTRHYIFDECNISSYKWIDSYHFSTDYTEIRTRTGRVRELNWTNWTRKPCKFTNSSCPDPSHGGRQRERWLNVLEETGLEF